MMSIEQNQIANESRSSPVDRVRIGRVEAAIWENTNEKHGTMYSVTIRRRYQDKNGDWQDARSFPLPDVPVAIFALLQAALRMSQLKGSS